MSYAVVVLSQCLCFFLVVESNRLALIPSAQADSEAIFKVLRRRLFDAARR
ncbi:Uncharacterized protein ChrSV_4542 [Chromobacterium vaccinii]|nr:Uncharacterized protein ChrSW_4542 [Chromobacterium vaccinii]QND91998.1 Uncharacterized protein ChrSV_4542 [Chromobacterium vaccinii]